MDRDELRDATAKLYAKALAFHLTGNSAYAAQVRTRILEMSQNKTPGVNVCDDDDGYSGGNGCILTAGRHISGYIASADLIETYLGWTAEDKLAFRNWLKDYIYKFTDWASDQRSHNWGSVGSATTHYIADYFAGSGLSLVDRNGVSFTPKQAFDEATQRVLERHSGNNTGDVFYSSDPNMTNSVCPYSGANGISWFGGIPEELGRENSDSNPGLYCSYQWIPSAGGDAHSYYAAHLSGTLMSAELLWRRSDSLLYDYIDANNKGSILMAIRFVIDNPVDVSKSQNWFPTSRSTVIEIAYRYYSRNPATAGSSGVAAMANQLGLNSTRLIAGGGNSAMPHFGTLTHGYTLGENITPPPTSPKP
jgi:hypothetical protein